MLLNAEHVGQHVLMKHKVGGEIFTGLIVDGDERYAVIKMEKAAGYFIKDEFCEIDTRYDEDWIFVEIKKDVSVSDNGIYQH